MNIYKWVVAIWGIYLVDKAIGVLEKKVDADVDLLRAQRAALPDPWDLSQKEDREKEALKVAESTLDATRDTARMLRLIERQATSETTLAPETINKLRDAILDAVTAPTAPAAPVVTRTDAQVETTLTAAVQVAEAVAQAIEPAPALALVPEVIKVES
jgi:hypothetical protein